MDWLFKNTALAGCVVLITALTGLTGYLGVQAYNLSNEKAELTTKIATAAVEAETLRFEKAALAQSVRSLKNEIDLAKQMQGELEDAIKQQLKLRQDAADKLKEIENAKPSEDGPVAPVLRRTLDGMR